MESGLTMLASIGSTAPFVGLFGTVLGIMHAMHNITASGSTSLDVVAGPIGDALVATAIGIAVAVPAVLAYNFFLRRAKLQRAGLENFVVSFMHAVFSADGQIKEG
jgi:biopolymer transport protein ExbB